jgi:hypothetical protein
MATQHMTHITRLDTVVTKRPDFETAFSVFNSISRNGMDLHLRSTSHILGTNCISYDYVIRGILAAFVTCLGSHLYGMEKDTISFR